MDIGFLFLFPRLDRPRELGFILFFFFRFPVRYFCSLVCQIPAGRVSLSVCLVSSCFVLNIIILATLPALACHWHHDITFFIPVFCFTG